MRPRSSERWMALSPEEQQSVLAAIQYLQEQAEQESEEEE